MQKENLLKIGLIIVVFLLSVCLLSILLIERKEEFDTIPNIKRNDEKYEEKTVEEIEKMIFGESHKKKISKSS